MGMQSAAGFQAVKRRQEGASRSREENIVKDGIVNEGAVRVGATP